MSGNDNDRDSRWWLPRFQWNKMRPPERLEHCINVNAYFRSEERRRRGLPPNDFQDRVAAEAEIKELVGLQPSIINAD